MPAEHGERLTGGLPGQSTRLPRSRLTPDPLINTYKPLAHGPVRDAVLAMARSSDARCDGLEGGDGDALRQAQMP